MGFGTCDFDKFGFPKLGFDKQKVPKPNRANPV
jgi:hypothetical protein